MEVTINKFKWQLLRYGVCEKRSIEAVAFIQEKGFQPILIKGWAAAQFYTKPFERDSSDVDLIISPAEYSQALKISGNYHGSTYIDLHCGTKHLDTVSYENLFKNSRLVNCGDIEIRILRPEDHLRVLCVHWLTDGGAYKHRLWDVYYAVKNRPADFDWERCLNVVSETRKKWIVCTIALAHKYLGLPLEDTPIAGSQSEIPKWVIKTVEAEWANGVRLVPLQDCLNDKKRLWQQIKKRLPPNPIQATIEMEGEFDDKSRLPYQIGDILLRLKPSVKRIFRRIFYKS